MLAPHDIHHNHHHHHNQQQAMPHDRHALPPISRTIQYKKVTKPLLERKRRARINRCLDELKDLMVGAFEADGENVSKLEKADILELTVRHLHRLRRPRDAAEEAHRYQIGFTQCATEAYQFLLSSPGVDLHIVRRLLAHLRQRAVTAATPNTTPVPGPLSVQVPVPSRMCYSPPVSPASPASSPPTTSYPVVLSSTPSVQELSRPHTGLLMTVSKNQTAVRNPQKQDSSPTEQSVWRPW